MNLQHRQSKIQEKRKNTPRREFVMEIASRFPVNLYKDTGIISRYPSTNRLGNIQKTIYFNENRDNIKEERNLYTGNFFESLFNLQKDTPFPATINYGGIENSEYADITHNSKNIYLSFNSVRDTENICYSMCVKDQSRNVYNSLMVRDGSDNIYSSQCIIRSTNIYYSKFINDSSYLWFCSNCVSCYECISCSNIEHKKYCINNQQYNETDYKKQKDIILQGKASFDNYYAQVSNKGNNIASDHVEGVFNVGSENIINGYMSYHTKNGRNLFISGSSVGNTEMYDNFIGGSSNSSHYYGTCASGTAEHLYCCDSVGLQSSYMFYCVNCMGCSFCLGCIGLKNKSYCILNKQYTKEERYTKVDEIFTQMEKDGQLGEFFPATMNPFYFNDTAAYLIDPSFTKEEVIAKGYLWRDEAIKVDIPEGMKVVTVKELENYEGRITDTGLFMSIQEVRNTQSEILPSHNRSINPDILKVTIQDEQGNYYRIIPMEYKFLVKHGLPLPRKHWLERMKESFRIS